MTELTRRELLQAMFAAGAGTALPASIATGATTAAAAGAGTATSAVPTPATRERLLFDFGWRFHLGHAEDPAKDFNFGTYQRTYAKAGKDTADAAMPGFDDTGWEAIDLPHDWAVTLPFVPNPRAPKTGDDPAAAHGYRPLGREFPETSIGWYRRMLEIPAGDLGKRVVLEFDGVFRDCIVFCNGHVAGRNASGYIGFEVDLTDLLDYGGSNVIAVRVDASLGEGWFYEGAGIYRHLWLRKNSPLHLPQAGTSVRCEPRGSGADCRVDSAVRNDGSDALACTVAWTVYAPDGKVAARLAPIGVDVPAGESRCVEQHVNLAAPALWSPDTPHLYRLVAEVRSANALHDVIETSFGIRSIAFDAERGFLLNGAALKLLGTCNHQDHAGVGTAIPDRLHEWRIERLKSMGSNALRSSHNPATPALLDLCDRLGMLVIAETRRMSSGAEAMDELERMIRRDRNHPCIVAWSLGNEEPEMVSERGARIVASMQRRVRRLDPTRPTTFAMDNGWEHGVGQVVDVVGFNYRTNQMGDFHARFPRIPVYGSETASTVAVRGNYRTDDAKEYARAYDLDYPSWGSNAESWWSYVAERAYIAGGFVWTGFDYRGEPTPYNHWPNVASQFGIFDSCGFPKDNYWYYRAQWTHEPVLHLFPHWNWDSVLPEAANGMVEVWCHSNLEEVELLVNGKSQGRLQVPRHGHVEWRVKYASGNIEARGYRGGKQVARERRETSGAAARIVLRTERTALLADAEDTCVVAVEIVDAQGRSVPTAGNVVDFKVSGAGRLLGVGNGDPASHEPDRAASRRAFNGLCMAIVATGRSTGTLRIEATSAGLRNAVLDIPVQAATGRAHVT